MTVKPVIYLKDLAPHTAQAAWDEAKHPRGHHGEWVTVPLPGFHGEAVTGWHFDKRDTPQQRAILRQVRRAQYTRKHFPAGTRVRATASGALGTVERHVPGVSAQGGYLVVNWDTGTAGRAGPIAVERVRPAG